MKYTTYGELDLRSIRDKCLLDFAHWSFQKNMRSSKNTPEDMSEIYWRGHKVKHDDYTYVLFKNSLDEAGIVRKRDFIKDNTLILCRFDDKAKFNCETQKSLFCRLLSYQLSPDYRIGIPNSEGLPIKIICKCRAMTAEELTSDYTYIDCGKKYWY